MKKVIGIKCLSIGLLTLFSLGGCVSSGADQVQLLQKELSKKNNEISTLSSELKATVKVKLLQKQLLEKDNEISTLSSEIEATGKNAELKKAIAMKETNLLDISPLLPPNPKIGECYARVFVSPKYKTVSETIIKKQESEWVRIIPAKYDFREKKVLVKEASEKIKVIPAQYGLKTEKVLISEASYRMVDVPAEYTWVNEKIMLKPAHAIWKKGKGLVERVDNNTGEIMCLVEVPATYKTVKKKNLKSSATSRQIKIPAQYNVMTRKILKTPATVKKIVIPEEYKIIKVREMIIPPMEKRIIIPAEYTTIKRTEKVTDGKLEWRRVLCKTNMGEDIIKKLQITLRDNGHDPVFTDGVVGWRTMKALKAYQKEKGLAVGNITYETLESLQIVRNQ